MELTKSDLQKMRKEYEKDQTLHVAQRAVMKNGILNSAENQDVIAENQFQFSVDVDSEAVANQKQTGRCWMFAALNTLRFHIEKDLNLPHGTFELSQNYTFFHDKLEKSNWFHQQIVDSAQSPLSDRWVNFLLTTPQQDGGDFDIIAGLIAKYGVIPRKWMDETQATISSAELDTILNRKLRQDALHLRKLVDDGATETELNSERRRLLGDVYKILAVALGTPPETIDFEYRDKDGKYHADRGLTPMDFMKKYVPINLADYVAVINVPVDDMPYGSIFGFENSQEVIDGRPNRYLNVPMDDLKAVAIKQLQEGEPVWFTCDVMQDADIHKGVLSTDLFSFGELFGIEFTMDKTERFLMMESFPTHAMTLAGVDLDGDKPTKWKIENSWGAEVKGQPVGDDGYYVMSDDWMDNYVYEVAVRKDLLPEDLQKAWDAEPVILPFYNTFYPL